MQAKDKLIFAFLVALTASVVWLVLKTQTPPQGRIAYVRVWELLTQYEGMKEANAKMNSRQSEQQGNLSDLKRIYEAEVTQYQQNGASLSPEEQQAAQQKISMAQQNLITYQQTIENATLEDDPFTQGVLKQLDEFLKKYGEANGYKLILGSDESGNVLYADDAIDITDEVILALNAEYTGKKQ